MRCFRVGGKGCFKVWVRRRFGEKIDSQKIDSDLTRHSLRTNSLKNTLQTPFRMYMMGSDGFRWQPSTSPRMLTIH